MKVSIITVTHNRLQLLQSRALQSITSQTSKDFEWIVVNDGADEEVRRVLQEVKDIDLVYLEMEHNGFGLCRGRNLALEHASGDLVCYLDDDNLLHSDYVSRVLDFHYKNRDLKYFMPIQNRRRDIVKNGQIVKEGNPFLSLEENAGIQDLINPQKVLFDSNGFVHILENAPLWDEMLRIYCDYEYFLQCIGRWGMDSFGVLPEVLIDYIQTNEGEVGRSNYGIWTRELEYIWANRNRYEVLNDPNVKEGFSALIMKFQKNADDNKEVRAFKL